MTIRFKGGGEGCWWVTELIFDFRTKSEKQRDFSDILNRFAVLARAIWIDILLFSFSLKLLTSAPLLPVYQIYIIKIVRKKHSQIFLCEYSTNLWWMRLVEEINNEVWLKHDFQVSLHSPVWKVLSANEQPLRWNQTFRTRFDYTWRFKCLSKLCTANNARNKPLILPRESSFRLQERGLL